MQKKFFEGDIRHNCYLDLDNGSKKFGNHRLTQLPKHHTPSPNHQFSQLTWYVEYYSMHAHMAWNQKFRKSEISLDTGITLPGNFYSVVM